MIRLDAPRGVEFCDGLTRRDFIHAGALAGLGITLPGFLHAKSDKPASSDVNCILLFLVGAPSQIDTWDPKPNAPAEIRGPYKPIATKAPGMMISEVFPKMAAQADKFSLIRSTYHTAAAVHDTGHQMMQTGRLFTGGIEHPHIGCSLTYLKGPRNELPAHVMLPKPIGNTGGNMPHGQSAGYLGRAYDPFTLNSYPEAKDFHVPDLLPPDYLATVRGDRRRKLRESIDGATAAFESSPAAKQMDDHFAAAYKLMSSSAARDAFDLAKEAPAMRDRYGRTRFGQSCLMARRLIEAGVRFVTVNMFETVFNEVTWDIHGSKPFTDIETMGKEVVPNFDQAYSALLEDLHQRGMLSNTVVLGFGEFGRTPKINPAGGRDHHPGVWTTLIAGGPIRGGRVIGESDEWGYAPKTRPTTPAEIAATVFKSLGLNPHHDLPGPQGRPIPLADYNVRPIEELF
ncbi:MAG: DUF1501 domain-containing protein [Gemmataceae bacterium]|nr:DUF1501 domain-containing protein [Gemmataceae bacterium]